MLKCTVISMSIKRLVGGVHAGDSALGSGRGLAIEAVARTSELRKPVMQYGGILAVDGHVLVLMGL